MGDVTLIVVNFHTASHLERLLQSAVDHPPFRDARWIVVDNTPDGDDLPDLPGSVRLVPLNENIGFAAACNLAAREANTPFIFLCNPDLTFLQPLDSLLDLVTGDVAGAAPIIEPRQRFQLRRFPTPLPFFFDFCGPVNLWPGNPVSRRYYYDAVNPATPFDVLQPAACALLLQRDLDLEMGGFDTIFYPAWFEDVDLAWRIHGKGYRLLCDPRLTVGHTLGVSAERLGRRLFLTTYARNYRHLIRKHLSIGPRLLARSFLSLGLLLRGMRPW